MLQTFFYRFNLYFFAYKVANPMFLLNSVKRKASFTKLFLA